MTSLLPAIETLQNVSPGPGDDTMQVMPRTGYRAEGIPLEPGNSKYENGSGRSSASNIEENSVLLGQ